MDKIEHHISHTYQPTNTTCSQTALSILLSHYENIIEPLELEERIPQTTNELGEKQGTINQHLATWCLSQGFNVTMYTFDCQIIDQSWSTLEKDELITRLKLRKDGWVVPGMGEQWTIEYTQGYIDFMEAGGELHIQQAVTSDLLYELLQKGPLLPCVSFSTLYGSGRTVLTQEEDTPDDINGRATNHSIVIYGNDENGNFLVADPFKKPGKLVIDKERMLAAISTAQIECDNLLFQLYKK